MRIKQAEYGYEIVLTANEYEKNGFDFIAFGCSGTGNADTYNVGNAIRSYAKQKQSPIIGFHTGDICYGDASKLNEAFFKPFSENGVPFFYAPGNHEFGFDKMEQFTSGVKSVFGFSNNLPLIEEIKKKQVPLEQTSNILADSSLSKLNFKENFYYKVAIKVEDKKQPLMDFIILNSSKFVVEVNQQKWFRDTLDTSNALYCGVVGHHPIAAYGKHKHAMDAGLYEVDSNKGYIELYKEALLAAAGKNVSKIHFLLAAHEHIQVVSEVTVPDPNKQNPHTIVQLIDSGGGRLQNISYPSAEIAYHREGHGFIVASVKDDSYRLQLSLRDENNALLCSYGYEDNNPSQKLKAVFYDQAEAVSLPKGRSFSSPPKSSLVDNLVNSVISKLSPVGARRKLPVSLLNQNQQQTSSSFVASPSMCVPISPNNSHHLSTGSKLEAVTTPVLISESSLEYLSSANSGEKKFSPREDSPYTSDNSWKEESDNIFSMDLNEKGRLVTLPFASTYTEVGCRLASTSTGVSSIKKLPVRPNPELDPLASKPVYFQAPLATTTSQQLQSLHWKAEFCLSAPSNSAECESSTSTVLGENENQSFMEDDDTSGAANEEQFQFDLEITPTHSRKNNWS